MNVEMKFTTLPNGFRCYYQHWFPERPRALIIMIHGLGDHIGRYNELVSLLGPKGFACALYDQRGHGQSEGSRGHISSFETWLEDMSEFIKFSVKSYPPNLPIYLIGGSLGALICINYAVLPGVKIAGIALASAAVWPHIRIPKWKLKIARTLGKLYPSLTVFNGLQFEEMTLDPDEIAAVKKDPFFHRRISLGAAVELEKKLNVVMAMPHRIHVPALVIAGSDDPICDPQGSKQFCDRLSSSDKKFILYSGMRHDLLHDVGRRRVMEDIVNWFVEQTGGPEAEGEI